MQLESAKFNTQCVVFSVENGGQHDFTVDTFYDNGWSYIPAHGKYQGCREPFTFIVPVDVWENKVFAARMRHILEAQDSVLVLHPAHPNLGFRKAHLLDLDTLRTTDIGWWVQAKQPAHELDNCTTVRGIVYTTTRNDPYPVYPV